MSFMLRASARCLHTEGQVCALRWFQDCLEASGKRVDDMASISKVGGGFDRASALELVYTTNADVCSCRRVKLGKSLEDG